MVISIRNVVLLVSLLLAGCATGPARDVDLAKQGHDAMEAGDAAKAEELLKEALADNPDNPYALTDLGALYLKRYQHEQARPLYQQVVDRKAEYEEAAATQEEIDEAARLQQLAREKLDFIAAEEAADQEALALAPPGAAQEPAVETPPQQPAPQTSAGHATAPVAPVALATPPTPAAPRSGYQIQIGAFKSQARAERMGARLKALPAEVIQGKEIVLTQAGSLIKVHVVPYATFKEATNACEALKKSGISCFPRKQ